MKNIQAIEKKIILPDKIESWVKAARILSKTIAFTYGFFDLLEEKHIYSLSQAAKEADLLLVGINSDNSIKKLKGDNRPVNNEHKRTLILAALLIVDAVVIFEEDTPLELLKKIMPDALVKDANYTFSSVVGVDEVIANGGRVIITPLPENFSNQA
jgi:D-glycero-beta-D-manno-heptose 1-phosphate adenylyltransferase